MPTITAQKKLINLIELIPESRTKEAETFLRSLITKKKIKQSSKDEDFDKDVKYMESLPVGEPLTPEEKTKIDKARAEYIQGECSTLKEFEKEISDRKRKGKKE